MPEKQLSTKWYNVIRRELNKPAPNERDDVPCPDCGSETYLSGGRYGRFYACTYCSGTRGAKMDGTPRRERGTPEEIEVRHRARDALHRLVVFWETRKEVVYADFHAVTHSYHLRRGILEEVLEDAGVPLKPPPIYIRKRRNDWEYLILPVRVEYREGVYLPKRTLEECRRIEAVATAKLRELRNDVWDRLISDAEPFEGRLETDAVPVQPHQEGP